MKLSREPLRMCCGDQLCVNVCHIEPRESKGDLTMFVARTYEEVKILEASVVRRKRSAFCRAREFYPSETELFGVLRKLDRGHEDQDSKNDEACLYWYGDKTCVDTPIVRMIKPSEKRESVTSVNGVLTFKAFIFAPNDSFKELMKLRRKPLRMCCGDQLCVNVCHISMGKKARV